MNNILLSLFLLVITPAAIMGQSADTRKKNFNVKKGAAMEGFDPVSYFDGHPKEGKEEFAFTYQGVPYRFSSKVNLDKFRANPANYEPAYGGWCAFAMGDSGEKVKIDPETYKIQDGKLYLFYNFWGSNTLTDWNKNEKLLMTKGDQHWSGILKQ